MPLHSVGRMLRTVGGAPLRVGTNAVVNERDRPNLCPPFSAWTLEGGATVDAAGVLTLPALNAKATSPLLPVNGADFMTFSSQAFSSVASPYPAYNGAGARLFTSQYYASNGTTPAFNTLNNSSNGNARPFALDAWTPNRLIEGGFNINGGPAVRFARWVIAVDATYSSRPIQFRDPMFITLANTATPYRHYYRKGL